METTRIPSNVSHQHLMANEENDNCVTVPARQTPPVQGVVTIREWITVLILCYVNLINYMDRFTIAGILGDIKDHFGIGDDSAGLLQTAFILSYMIFAPLFGYLGDRYNRKLIMSFGVFLWCITTLIGSYMTDFGWFISFRAFVGIGEASYSTIAPTIISDLFIKDVRTKMLALFYFAIPVGSGLGYIIGSETARLAGSWQWGLRVTPALGLVAVLLLLFVVQDPIRGGREGGSHVTRTSWGDDINSLCKNSSFMLSTAGFTCVAFVAGALAWWGPTFIYLGFQLQPGGTSITKNDVAFNFGLIAMLAGIIGVPLGSFLAQWLRVRYPPADPLICAVGLIISAPLIFFAAISASKHTSLCYTLIFFGQLMLNLNWSIVADMLLYVVIPTRRSTAEAFQILIAHALGDAGSPYIIGKISEELKKILPVKEAHATTSTLSSTTDPQIEFTSLQYALFLTIFVEVLGGLFFFLTALYIQRDKAIVELSVADSETDSETSHICDDEVANNASNSIERT